MSRLKCIIIWLLAICIVIGIPFLIIFYLVEGKDPTFTVHQASINGFNLTADGHLTCSFNIEIRAHNPNRIVKLTYGKVRVSIFKDKEKLAEDALKGFTQHKRNVTVLRAQPVALYVALKKNLAFNIGIESGLGYFDFDVFITADLDGDNLEVNCKHVNVTVASNSAHIFQTRSCSVDVYNDDVYYYYSTRK